MFSILITSVSWSRLDRALSPPRSPGVTAQHGLAPPQTWSASSFSSSDIPLASFQDGKISTYKVRRREFVGKLSFYKLSAFRRAYRSDAADGNALTATGFDCSISHAMPEEPKPPILRGGSPTSARVSFREHKLFLYRRCLPRDWSRLAFIIWVTGGMLFP